MGFSTRRTVALAAAIWAALLAPESAQAQGKPNVIKIVSSLPRTGSAKGQTDTIVNGIQMALDEAGHRAGGFEIEYEDLDDATAADGKWNSDRERANADFAIKNPDVMAYIGPYNSGAAKVSAPILNGAGLVTISPAVTGPGFTKPGKGDPGEPEIYRRSGKITFFRVVPADDLQGTLAADYAKLLGCKRVYVLDDTEVYGKGVATIFRRRCNDIGVRVMGKQESIDFKQSDFRTLMTKIRKFKPDLIYFGGTSQTGAGQIAKDMVATGLGNAFLMMPDGCYENALITGAGAETFKTLKAYITFGGVSPDKMVGKGKEFVEKYKNKFGVMPEGYAAYGYECAKVVLAAIDKAGVKNREAIRAALASTKNYDGALGRWSFDANGDTSLDVLSVSTVEDGEFKFVQQLKPNQVSLGFVDDDFEVVTRPFMEFLQFCWIGLVIGLLFALIALGYTMVYGIVELINFAHGEVFMLGTFAALTILSWMGLTGRSLADASGVLAAVGFILALIITPMFCAGLNWGIESGGLPAAPRRAKVSPVSLGDRCLILPPKRRPVLERPDFRGR